MSFPFLAAGRLKMGCRSICMCVKAESTACLGAAAPRKYVSGNFLSQIDYLMVVIAADVQAPGVSGIVHQPKLCEGKSAAVLCFLSSLFGSCVR